MEETRRFPTDSEAQQTRHEDEDELEKLTSARVAAVAHVLEVKEILLAFGTQVPAIT